MWGREYINGKFRRLMLPYFWTCLIVLITDVVLCYPNGNFSISTVTEIIARDILRSFFASGAVTQFGGIEIGTRIGAIWFLPAMFFAVIIFQWILQRTEDSVKLGMITGSIAFLGFVSARFIWLPFSIQSGMAATFFLWIGYEIKKQRILDKVHWYHYLIALCVFCGGVLAKYANVSFVNAWCQDIFLSVLTGLAGSLLVYLVARMRIPGLDYLGKISLTILCTHLYALEILWGYFSSLLDRMGLTGNFKVWGMIVAQILFAVFAAIVVDMVSRGMKSCYYLIMQRIKTKVQDRNADVDLAKGVLIILMLAGCFEIDDSLYVIIFSFHMVAFVFFSGYFYQKRKPPGQMLCCMIRNYLFPYIGFVAINLLITNQFWSGNYMWSLLQRYMVGMSASDTLFPDLTGIGLVYFILVLFIVQLLYMLIDYCVKTTKQKWGWVIGLSLVGLLFGRVGFWLPWSIDIAMYALIFYHLGVEFRRKNILNFIRENCIIYFFLSVVWAYMIYIGGMEITSRNYGEYGIAIFGAMSGTLLLYMLSVYINRVLPGIRKIFQILGHASLYILIIHTLCVEQIEGLVSHIFDMDNSSFLVVTCLIQLLLGGIVYMVINIVKRLFVCRKNSDTSEFPK